MRLARVVLLGSVVALGAVAPAGAAQVEVKAVEPPPPAEPTWDSTQVPILPGDTVVWTFAGTTGIHNVMSSGGDWTYQSSKAVQFPPNGSWTFDTPGRYDFVCEVHATTMYGTVVVGEPPPPPLSEQPFPNDGGVLGALETGGLDRTQPKLGSVRVQRMKRGARVRFRVSERSLVTVRFKRGGKIVKTKKVGAAGTARATVRKGLRAGRYRVELRAEDLAGNRSATRTARLTIR